MNPSPGRDGSGAGNGSRARHDSGSLCWGRGTLRGVSPGLFLSVPLGVPDVAKKTRRQAKTVEHDGTRGAKRPAEDGPLPAAERTGDIVPDVRCVHRDHPDGRTVRLALRRGGTPVALTPDEAEALASQLQDVARQGR